MLLLFLNNVPNIDGVIPGKMYEYIGARRPILCVGKKTGDASVIIKKTKAGVPSTWQRIFLRSKKRKLFDIKNNFHTSVNDRMEINIFEIENFRFFRSKKITILEKIHFVILENLDFEIFKNIGKYFS